MNKMQCLNVAFVNVNAVKFAYSVGQNQHTFMMVMKVFSLE